LNSLRSRLTVELALKLCKDCAIGSFYAERTLHSRQAMEVYLQLLIDIFPMVPRSRFFAIFPKDCGGCTVNQLYAIVALHQSFHVQVHNLLKSLLCDDRERILSLIPDVHEMSRIVVRDYNIPSEPFPDYTVCLSLARNSQGRKIVEALGAMMQDTGFLDLVKNRDERAVKIAKQMFSDDGDERDFPYLLRNLLKSI
jgi:hypothetical protein